MCARVSRGAARGRRSCYASPIRRARRFAEIMWEGRDTPLVCTDSLKEAYLGWLQGMKQGAPYPTLYRNPEGGLPGLAAGHEAECAAPAPAPAPRFPVQQPVVHAKASSFSCSGKLHFPVHVEDIRSVPVLRTLDIKRKTLTLTVSYLTWRVRAAEEAAAQHETTFRQWRENPAAFGIGDRYPVDEVFAEAKNAWQRARRRSSGSSWPGSFSCFTRSEQFVMGCAQPVWGSSGDAQAAAHAESLYERTGIECACSRGHAALSM